MFVQSARFVEEHRRKAVEELMIHGVEKVDDTGRLCRLNLAVHGLEGDIRHGGDINSYYDDPHQLVSKFDFVLANPPFTAPTRPEIGSRFGMRIERLKWKGEGYDGVRTYKSFGIVCVPDLYTPRK